MCLCVCARVIERAHVLVRACARSCVCDLNCCHTRSVNVTGAICLALAVLRLPHDYVCVVFAASWCAVAIVAHHEQRGEAAVLSAVQLFHRHKLQPDGVGVVQTCGRQNGESCSFAVWFGVKIAGGWCAWECPEWWWRWRCLWQCRWWYPPLCR